MAPKTKAGRQGGRERGSKSKMPCLDFIRKSLGKRATQTLAWKVEGWGRICQVGTGGCWENLEARSALTCKIGTSLPCPCVQNQTKIITLLMDG